MRRQSTWFVCAFILATLLRWTATTFWSPTTTPPAPSTSSVSDEPPIWVKN